MLVVQSKTVLRFGQENAISATVTQARIENEGKREFQYSKTGKDGCLIVDLCLMVDCFKTERTASESCLCCKD